MYSSFPNGRTLKCVKLGILESSRGTNRLTGVLKFDVSIPLPEPFDRERLITADWTFALELSQLKGLEENDVI